MSDENDKDEGFSYEGYLLFNEVCTASPLDDTDPIPNHTREAESELLKILPDFEEGTPRNPGKGYERLLLRDYVSDAKLPQEMKEFLKSLGAFRYRVEEYDEEIGFVDGERKEVEIPSESHGDVLWAKDYVNKSDETGVMLFRGSESDASKAKSQTQTASGDRLSIQSITFTHQFLFWLFEKAHNGGELSENLQIKSLANAGVSGEEDLYGGEASINKSDDIKRSDPLLLGLLRNKKFENIEGDFMLDFSSEEGESDTIDSVLVRADIQREKIHVKASKAGLKNAGEIEKLGVASHLTAEFAKLFEQWDESPKEDKFVSPEFIVELMETCLDRDIGYRKQPEQVLRTQANERDEELTDYDLGIEFGFDETSNDKEENIVTE